MMIALSHNVTLPDNDNEEWYSWANQRKMSYVLAKELLLSEDMTPAQAVETAVEFHREFYERVMKIKR